jgi:hypothetical protein
MRLGNHVVDSLPAASCNRTRCAAVAVATAGGVPVFRWRRSCLLWRLETLGLHSEYPLHRA